MMKIAGSRREQVQLASSIEKLLHYLLVFVRHDTQVEISLTPDGENPVYKGEFQTPKQISISPTLYTRIDDCHGAGNCCRVPFDLVYTDYCRDRILNFDYNVAVDRFGEESAERFEQHRVKLLGSLEPLYVGFTQKHDGIESGWFARLWVQSNTEVFELSGNRSCPYLQMSNDRYYCGVHPFKPLHCWYPHMTVRVTHSRETIELASVQSSSHRSYQGLKGRPTVSIGRMQYGRNHKFGCPVLFSETSEDEIFGEADESYFTSQFNDDIEKLRWTSRAAKSMGFSVASNFAVGIHNVFRAKKET
ncbi:MAG: hypothetical protein ACXABY_15730, partial [Candidatus Thorarchaeota archaeon]